MTTRRDFIAKAAVGSLVASTPFARARALAPPSPPTSLVIGDQAAPSPLPGTGFYEDPYSGYATWYVNGNTGVDATGHQPAGHTYKTYQSALNDVFYVGNPGARRIIVSHDTVVTLSAAGPGIYFPAGGPDAAHLCVLQGDPASTTLPIYDGGLQSAIGFAIGTAGGFGTAIIPVHNAVIRKIEMRNFGAQPLYFGGTPYVTTVSNFVVEYVYCHNTVDQSNGANGETGFAYFPNANSCTGVTFRYCKISDISNTAGSYVNDNLSAFGSYGANNITIDHCLISKANHAVRFKTTSPPATENNWTITNNIFSQVQHGVQSNHGVNGDNCESNLTVTGNLFYGPAVPGGTSVQAMAFANEPVGAQGSTLLFANNTIGQDALTMFSWKGCTGVTVRDNLSLASLHHFEHTPNVSDAQYNANCAVVFSQIDYNAYGGSSIWQLGWQPTPYYTTHLYNTFARWQAAHTSPRDRSSSATAPSPPELATVGNPDQHGVWIPNLSSPHNTIAGNMSDPSYATSRNYTIAAGSPLLTASSTGGRVGCDPTNIGPGW
jgi:hypothetical protein